MDYRVDRRNDEGYVHIYPKKYIKRKAIACFDIDGTIIKTKSGKKFARDKYDWTFWSDNVKEKLHSLKKHAIIFFTNQKGLQKKEDKLNNWLDKCLDILNELNLPVQVYVATGNNRYRKPSLGMWDLVEKEWKNIDKERSFYCGDAAGRKGDFSDSDRKFALNIGIDFFTPEEFFYTLSDKQEYKMDKLDFSVYKKNKQPNIQNFIVDGQQLVIMVGYPGSGKSTLANKIAKKYKKFIVVNQDTCKTLSKCIKLAKQALNDNKSVIIDNTNSTRKTRMKYLNIKVNSHKTLIHMTTPIKIAQHNNKYREYITKGENKRVPDVVYYTFRKKYEPPDEQQYDKLFEIKFTINKNTPKEYFMHY